MSYTPGPWKMTFRRKDDNDFSTEDIISEDNRRIANCYGGHDVDPWLSNARLIAASPEMYEALSRLVDAVMAIKSSEFDRASDWVKLDDVLIECERVMGKAVSS